MINYYSRLLAAGRVPAHQPHPYKRLDQAKAGRTYATRHGRKLLSDRKTALPGIIRILGNPRGTHNYPSRREYTEGAWQRNVVFKGWWQRNGKEKTEVGFRWRSAKPSHLPFFNQGRQRVAALDNRAGMQRCPGRRGKFNIELGQPRSAHDDLSSPDNTANML